MATQPATVPQGTSSGGDSPPQPAQTQQQATSGGKKPRQRAIERLKAVEKSFTSFMKVDATAFKGNHQQRLDSLNDHPSSQQANKRRRIQQEIEGLVDPQYMYVAVLPDGSVLYDRSPAFQSNERLRKCSDNLLQLVAHELEGERLRRELPRDDASQQLPGSHTAASASTARSNPQRTDYTYLAKKAFKPLWDNHLLPKIVHTNASG